MIIFLVVGLLAARASINSCSCSFVHLSALVPGLQRTFSYFRLFVVCSAIQINKRYRRTTLGKSFTPLYLGHSAVDNLAPVKKLVE